VVPQSKEKGTIVGKNGRMKGRACSPALHRGIYQPAKQAWKSPVWLGVMRKCGRRDSKKCVAGRGQKSLRGIGVAGAGAGGRGIAG
jgi:hypothetical protein